MAAKSVRATRSARASRASRAVGVAERLVPLLERLIGADLPLRVRAWDGSEHGQPDAPLVVVRSRRAVRRLLWQPNELGLARAYVTGEVEVEDDLFRALDAMSFLVRRDEVRNLQLSATDRRELMKLSVMLGAVGPQPRPPAEEVALTGVPHSRGRDRDAVSHHYDIGNDFYQLILGPSLVYSCAYWPDGAGATLEDAQRAKLDLVCRKLGLQPGMRLLDVGCGWGSLVLHAALEYGVTAVGITLSREQAELGRKRAAEAGLTEQVDIVHEDYRDLDSGPYDAIASIGMVEHVGEEHYPDYAGRLFALLRPGGRLLQQQVSRRPGHPAREPSFIQSYVFPDGELLPLAVTVGRLEEAGFEVRDVESLREHYGRTLRAWVTNLEAGWDRAVDLTTPVRARTWRLYMAGSALAFEAGRIGLHQILAVRAHPDGRSDLPSNRAVWWSAP
jgi:cyclopropane-fatty-acyl-phospholipid synthase